MKLKTFPLSCLTVATSFLFSAVPTYAQSDWGGACVGSAGAANDVATIQGLECLFGNVLQVIVTVAGLAFFIMFVVGGFNYLFSDNDPKKVAVASSTLTMAVAGLIGTIASFFILKFITDFTGVNVMDFVIPG